MKKASVFISILLLFVFIYVCFNIVQNDLIINRVESKLSKPNVDLFLKTKFHDAKLAEVIGRQLLKSKNLDFNQLNSVKRMYLKGLSKKPSWPYLYSGILQANVRLGDFDIKDLRSAIKAGSHELKVVKSIAEVYFTNYKAFSAEQRTEVESYFGQLSEANINRVVNIAVRFGRLFEFCDYLYSLSKYNYSSCKSNYWKPLIQ